MKKHYKWNIKKFISNLIVLISVIMLAWGVLSYLEVCAKNIHPNPHYSQYNMIEMLVERFG